MWFSVINWISNFQVIISFLHPHQILLLVYFYFLGEPVQFEGRLLTTQISRLQDDFDGSPDAKEINKWVEFEMP